jgi:hypothetical protein
MIEDGGWKPWAREICAGCEDFPGWWCGLTLNRKNLICRQEFGWSAEHRSARTLRDMRLGITIRLDLPGLGTIHWGLVRES